MHRHQRIVFGNMGGIPREETIPSEDEVKYAYNTLVFEIGANWEFVINMMSKVASETLKKVDVLEKDWLNFILQNQVNVSKYENSDQFIDEWFKK